MVELKQKEKVLFLDLATRIAKESSCKRLQVGAIVIKQVNERWNIISMGYNGTPPGEDNCCETENNVTKENVIHAEMNSLLKIKGENLENCVMIITHSPCKACAEELFNSGIKTIYYSETYRSLDGVEYLRSKGINVIEL